MSGADIAIPVCLARPLQSEPAFHATPIAVRACCGPSHGGSHRCARDRAPVALFSVPNGAASAPSTSLSLSGYVENLRSHPRGCVEAGTHSDQRGVFAFAAALTFGGMCFLRQNRHAPGGLGR